MRAGPGTEAHKALLDTCAPLLLATDAAAIERVKYESEGAAEPGLAHTGQVLAGAG